MSLELLKERFGHSGVIKEVDNREKIQEKLNAQFNDMGDFKNIKVQYLGNGPLTACYSLMYPYIRFLPIFSHLVLLICFMLDNILQIFIKTNLKEIFPIGIFFNAQKK